MKDVVSNPKTEMNTFTLPAGKKVRNVAHEIEDYLRNEEYMCIHKLRRADGTYIVQGKGKCSNISEWLGLNRTIIIRMVPIQSCQCRISIKHEKKRMRYVTLTFSLLFFWIVGFVALCSIIQEYCLRKRIKRLIAGMMTHDRQSDLKIRL